jgi:hypothetical protein
MVAISNAKKPETNNIMAILLGVRISRMGWVLDS